MPISEMIPKFCSRIENPPKEIRKAEVIVLIIREDCVWARLKIPDVISIKPTMKDSITLMSTLLKDKK